MVFDFADYLDVQYLCFYLYFLPQVIFIYAQLVLFLTQEVRHLQCHLFQTRHLHILLLVNFCLLLSSAGFLTKTTVDSFEYLFSFFAFSNLPGLTIDQESLNSNL